jgi:hypothetical protein
MVIMLGSENITFLTLANYQVSTPGKLSGATSIIFNGCNTFPLSRIEESATSYFYSSTKMSMRFILDSHILDISTIIIPAPGSLPG